MNEQIIIDISNKLNIKRFQTENTLKLLEDNNTIPFIARYRKEATNGLDENQIKQISDVYNYQVNLLKRKEDVIRLIDEKPRYGAGGARIAFLHPKSTNGVLVELCERKE